MLSFEISQRLLYFSRPPLIPSLKLFFIDLFDALLDEMSLCEAILLDCYSFCLDIWRYISRKFSKS